MTGKKFTGAAGAIQSADGGIPNDADESCWRDLLVAGSNAAESLLRSASDREQLSEGTNVVHFVWITHVAAERLAKFRVRSTTTIEDAQELVQSVQALISGALCLGDESEIHSLRMLDMASDTLDTLSDQLTKEAEVSHG